MLALFFLAACVPAADRAPTSAPTLTPTAYPTQLQPQPSTAKPLELAQPSPRPVPQSSPALTPGAGCQKPPEDYTRVKVNGMLVNRRTMFMLEQAGKIYTGEIRLTGVSITQGSYHDEPGGFGTHAGGGVVDISVMRPGTYTVLKDDIFPLVHALRLAGFAAWLRLPDELYDGSPIHIHAVAIGDRSLSPAAQAQVSGAGGYFAGYDGNPAPGKAPLPDRYGGPVLCPWMEGLSQP